MMAEILDDRQVRAVDEHLLAALHALKEANASSFSVGGFCASSRRPAETAAIAALRALNRPGRAHRTLPHSLPFQRSVKDEPVEAS